MYKKNINLLKGIFQRSYLKRIQEGMRLMSSRNYAIKVYCQTHIIFAPVDLSSGLKSWFTTRDSFPS